ncbi:MAG: hypothetical protein QHJ81_06980 [Anaerolineae bacterium]|nr:hypothetical protein [Anaerolineae bacterium]
MTTTVHEVVRDIAIIILAVESIIVGILLGVLTIQVSRLVKMLREEIKPMLEATQETVGTVKGTAAFLSEHLVSPVVSVASTVSGLRQAAKVLAGFRSHDRSDDPA